MKVFMRINRQVKWGVVLMYVQMILNIVINICYTPILIRMLGQSEYGIYNLAASIISYLSLFTLGFGSSYIRFYSKYKAQNDEEGIKRLNGLFLTVFSILSSIALIAGMILIGNVKVLFNSTYSANDLKIAKVLMIFLTFNLVISFPMSLFQSFITSQEKFIFQKLINIGKTILSPCLSIVVLYFGHGSIGMVVVTTIISLLIDITNILYCVVKLKMRIKIGKINIPLLKEIFAFSIFIAINQLIDQINGQTDKVILGKMINASAVAIYAVVDTIRHMYVTLSTSVSSVFAPSVYRVYNENKEDSKEQINELFIRIGRLQYYILMLVLTGFIFFGKYFINIWVGEDFSIVYWLVLLLIIPGTVPLIQNIGIEVQRAQNKHQFRSVVYLIVALTNLVISIIMCKFWGIIGVTLGTCFANVVGTIMIMNVYYHKKTGLNIIKFWKEILKASVGMIIPALFGVMILLFVNFSNVFMFLGLIILYAIIYLVSIYLISFNKEEKAFVGNILVKLRLKKRVDSQNIVSESNSQIEGETKESVEMVEENAGEEKSDSETTDEEIKEAVNDKDEGESL